MTRIAVVAMLFAAPAIAHAAPSAAAACGPEKTHFNVTLDKTARAQALPEPGKARVYFFADAGPGVTVGYPTTKLAVDGTWVGANHDNSYFSILVEPGEHHVCATLQSLLVAQRVELTHFNAAAEETYYFRTRLILSRSIEMLELEPIDSDEGTYLIATTALSVSSPKK